MLGAGPPTLAWMPSASWPRLSIEPKSDVRAAAAFCWQEFVNKYKQTPPPAAFLHAGSKAVSAGSDKALMRKKRAEITQGLADYTKQHDERVKEQLKPKQAGGGTVAWTRLSSACCFLCRITCSWCATLFLLTVYVPRQAASLPAA